MFSTSTSKYFLRLDVIQQKWYADAKTQLPEIATTSYTATKYYNPNQCIILHWTLPIATLSYTPQRSWHL